MIMFLILVGLNDLMRDDKAILLLAHTGYGVIRPVSTAQMVPFSSIVSFFS